jgi:hypothetical protein
MYPNVPLESMTVSVEMIFAFLCALIMMFGFIFAPRG